MCNTFRISGFTIAICLLASAAFAESGGTITGKIDGEAVTWTLRASQSDWSDYGVNIMGRDPQGVTTFPSIMIGFEKDGKLLARPEVRLSSQAQPNGYKGNEDEGIGLNVTRWEVAGDTLMVTGAIGGPVLRVVDPVRGLVDQKDSHELDLIFDLTITNP